MSPRDAAAALSRAEVEQPLREARLLFAHAAATGIDPASLVARRVAREPMAYITGQQGFWSIDLAVSPASIIPRADSETLIEVALAMRPDRRSVRRILDLGTGTGCLLLAALTEFPGAWGLGVDIGPDAAALAQSNAAALGLAGRAAFISADWGAALDGQFDLVFCNPPYISARDMDGLMPEVRLYEPHRALNGGGSAGLLAYIAVFQGLPRLMCDGALAIIEVGHNQESAVAALAADAGLTPHPARADLGGIPRALPMTKKAFGDAGHVG